MTNETQRQQAMRIIGTYAPHIREQHTAAWSRIESLVTSLLAKNAKVFEANHAIEHARAMYLSRVCMGMPADACEKFCRDSYSVDA